MMIAATAYIACCSAPVCIAKHHPCVVMHDGGVQNIANLCMASNPEERPTAAMVQRFLSDLLLEQAPNNAARQAAEEAALTQPPDEPSEPPARVSGCNPLAWLRHARAKRPV